MADRVQPVLLPILSMPVPMSDEQRRAAAALLREQVPAAAEIGRLFARHGYELALVGGMIRDVFLGRPSTGDLDLTTDATPEQVLALVDGWADATWTVGIAFGTVGLRKGSSLFEITTYRSEQYRATSRRPDVQYGRSLEEDLGRRDFTINAMAARLPGYELVDPFGGLEALREKVLRTPGRPEDSFSDDPLRILRAARFAATLGFTVAPQVRAAMIKQAPRLEIVSAERITAELTKLMLTPDPALGIDLLVQTGVADQVLPEVSRLRMEADEHHRHKDVYQHSLTVLRRAIELEPFYGLAGDLTVRLAALLHDIGKPKTRSLLPDGRVAFHHHEVVGAKMTRRRLTELRFPNDVVRDVSRLVELHLRFHGYGEGATGSDRGAPGGSSPAEPAWTDSAVRRYVRDAGPLLTRLHVLTRADCTTRNQAKAQRLARAYDGLEQRIAELGEQEELARIRPELDGNDIMQILGLTPGPLVGEAYGFMLELRIARGPIGREQATQELLRWAAEEGIPVPETPEPETGPEPPDPADPADPADPGSGPEPPCAESGPDED
jgi:poly(A) polymerase